MASKNKRKAAQRKAPDKPAEPNRRDTLIKWAQYATGVAALGVGGVLTVRSVEAHSLERDLTRMGQGKPTVVQVHDPRCPTCNALQRQARSALEQFGECDMLYLVADITTDEGAAFAARYGVPHITLLLFDGKGELDTTLQGMRYSEELSQTFAAHHKATAPRSN